MIPPLQFAGWEWLALALSAPVVLVAGLALPPGCRAQPPPRPDNDGHARLARHAHRFRLVARRPRSPSRMPTVLRGRCRDHDADPARSLPRGPRPPALGKRDPRVCSSSVPRRRTSPADGVEISFRSRSFRSATSSSCARRDDRHRRGRRARDTRPSISRCSRASPCPVEVGPGDEVTGATINTVRSSRSSGRRELARTRLSPRSCGSSPRRRQARRRSSGWSTESRPSSCRS